MSPRSRLWLSLPLAALSLLSLGTGGCQQILGIKDTTLDPESPSGGSTSSGGGSGPSSSGSSSTSPDFSFTVLTPNVSVPFGGKDVIEIEVSRTGGFTGEVTVTPVSPPVGLIIEPLTIPADKTQAEIVVGAEAPLTTGNKVSLNFSATSGELAPKMASVAEALVTGLPGALDPSFGATSTGIARVSFGADDGGGFYDLDVVGDQVVVAGYGQGGLGAVSFTVTRFASNGGLDPSFAMGTMVRTTFGSGSGNDSEAAAVGHQGDGKIIAMGSHQSPNPLDIAIARYGVNGSTGDPIFGNVSGGKSLIDLGSQETVRDGLVLQSNQILVAGQRGSDIMVARTSSSGYLDMMFGSPNGYVTLALGKPSIAQAIAVDSQNRIVVLGQAGVEPERDLVVARYLADGTLDATFGTDGVQLIEVQGADERAAAIALLPDGRILVAGDSNANGNLDFLVRRLLANGSPDLTFGTMGVALSPITTGNDSAEDMVALPDGRILVVGNARNGSSPGPVLARYTRNGALDPHFGVGGVGSLNVGDAGSIHCVAVYPGHKVVIGGGDEGGSPGPGTFGVVARLWM